MNSLEKVIIEFNKSISKSDYLVKENLRKEFVGKFPISVILSLTEEEYVIGRHNEDSFCYWIEYRLKELGDCRGSYANKYGVYIAKDGNKKHTKKYGSLYSEAFDNFKQEIYNLLEAAKEKNEKKIIDNVLSPMFKAKLLYLYYPKWFLPIYNMEHTKLFLETLNIPFNVKNVIELNKILLQWKTNHSNSIIVSWTNVQFMNFLYSNLWRLNSNAEELIDSNYIKQVNDYNGKVFDVKNVNRNKIGTVWVNSTQCYPRNYKLAKAVLINVGHKCEFNSNHVSFVRASDGTRYMEPHHLIPLSRHKEFDCSLDIPENIVCLCSDCHNRIHYGKDAKSLIEKLFNEKGTALNNAIMKATKNKQGITLDKLLTYC